MAVDLQIPITEMVELVLTIRGVMVVTVRLDIVLVLVVVAHFPLVEIL